MRPTCTTLLSMLALLAFLFYSLRVKNKNTIDVDLSGVGTCNGTQIYVQNASLWTQYPATPNTTRAYTVSPAFQGKNAIVWNDNEDVQDFVITNVNNMTVTTDKTLHVQGKCHFTLDAVSKVDTARAAAPPPATDPNSCTCDDPSSVCASACNPSTTQLSEY